MTDTVTAKLAEWEVLAEGGTEGEWRADSATGQVWATPGEPCLVATAGWVEDAEFIAHARTAMPALLGFVREVRELHRPTPIYEECATDRPTALCDRDDHLELGGGQWVHESEVLYDACEDCRDEDGSWVEWPCPTEQAARKWIGGEG